MGGFLRNVLVVVESNESMETLFADRDYRVEFI